MKVLYLVTKPRPFFTNQIRMLEEKGVETTVLEVPGRESQRDSRSVTDYLRFYPTVLRESIQEFDLVHANYGLTGPFALAQPRRPVVLSLWGTDLLGKYGAVSRWCARFSDAVILPSSVMSQRLKPEHTVIPFGVDSAVFRPMDRTTARNQIGWSETANIVLFPYAKNREVKNFPKAQRVVESADIDIELKQMSDVRHEKMPLYMNASDVLLLTSGRESGPMVVKEAVLCNLPVVSTDVGFVGEVLSDVSNSYVCDSESEMADRLDEILKKGARSEGRERLIDEIGLERMGERLFRVYERVL